MTVYKLKSDSPRGMLRISCQVFSRNGVGQGWPSSIISLQNINENNTIKDLLSFDCVLYLGMENEITLDEIIEWAEANDFTCVDDRTHGSIWIGSDGEELLDDEISEIIQKDRDEVEETYRDLFWNER